MDGPRGAFAPSLRAAGLVSLPAAVVFAVLAALGRLSTGEAVIGWLVVAAGTGLLIWPLLRGIGAASAFAERLAGGSEATAPRIDWPAPARALAAALARLERAWRARTEQISVAQAASETILDALADPLLLLARDRTVVFANRAAEKALGRVVGRNLASAVRVPAVLAAADAVFAGGAAQELSFTLGGERARHYTGRLQALGRALPRGATVALALHDTTEIERAQKLRVDFVANASHEIRTPLAALIGVIETLQGPARDDAEARERFLAMMDEHARRIARLVDDLLSLSRIELAEHEPPHGTIPVAALLEDARAALDWMAEARKVTITLDLPPGLPPLAGDADELHQLFRNLIDNAVKYGDADAGVTVAARAIAAGEAVDGWRAEGPAVAISVADRGPGVPAEHIPRLTERFFRVDTARSRQLGGTGLGLAIVKHIVNRHRGALAIDSTLGEGSTFTVYLPAAPAGADTKV